MTDLQSHPDNSPASAGSDPPADLRFVELLWPAADTLEVMSMVHRGILPCRAGQIIARIVDASPEVSPAPRVVTMDNLRLGKHVVLDKARNVFIAQQKGHACLHDDKLYVEETLNLPDDLDASSGPLTYDGDLGLLHNVLDSAILNATGDVTVFGSVEAAEIHAGRNLLVHHGICGKEKGRVCVGGNVTARFITNARVAAAGDIVVENEIANSSLTCGGMLKIERGTVLAGLAITSGGIICHTAGSSAGVKTVFELGLAPDQYETLQRTLSALEGARQKAQDIREAVRPLLARQKDLTPAQKEKATELLYIADEAEKLADEKLTAIQPVKAKLQTSLGASVHVLSVLHPGVIIRYPLAEAMVTQCLKGPCKISLSLTGTDPAIVVSDDHRGTSISLQTTSRPNVEAQTLRKILSHVTAAPASA